MNKIVSFLSLSALLLIASCGPEKQKTNPTAILVDTALSQTEQLAVAQPDPGVLKKLIKEMTYEEAAQAKMLYERDKNEYLAMKCAERMVAAGTNQEGLDSVYLQLANYYLTENRLEKAQKSAADYQTFYPGGERAREAAFIGLKATYLSQAGVGRDQTKTKETIELARSYLKKFPEDSQNLKAIEEMVHSCYLTLLETEIEVVHTYLARMNYQKGSGPAKAALKRVDYIKNKLLTYLPDQEERILNLEIAVAQAGNNLDIVTSVQKTLQEKFPKNQGPALAQDTRAASRKF